MQEANQIVPLQTRSALSSKNPCSLLEPNGVAGILKDLIPRAKIHYPNSTDEVDADTQPGWFKFNLGMSKDEIRVSLLAMKYSRVLWDKYNPKAENPEPKCKSSNGEISTGGNLYKQAQICAQCKFAQWSKDGTPPLCNDVYQLLMWDHQDEFPFIISAKRTSIYPLRKLKTALKMTARKWAWPDTVANASVSILMKTKQVENYWVLDFPQRDHRGAPLWQRLPEEKSLELTKVAYDLSKTFSELDLNEPGDQTETEATPN